VAVIVDGLFTPVATPAIVFELSRFSTTFCGMVSATSIISPPIVPIASTLDKTNIASLNSMIIPTAHLPFNHGALDRCA
jgi:hypothetical protein